MDASAGLKGVVRFDAEEQHFRTSQLITYLGNKRSLLGPIEAAVKRVRRRLGGRRLRILDAFSGSGVVSRLFKAHASLLVSNDIEPYAALVGRCFLANRGRVDVRALESLVVELNRRVEKERLAPGFIEEMYAPRDEANITAADRVFYTRENARRLDAYCRYIEHADAGLQDFLRGPLLGQASVHANTAGVFKGFYKDKRTGVGRYGGSGGDALTRIRGRIELETPVLSRHFCEVRVLREDANDLVRRLRNLDLVYLDPPYNQHPYGSNYFMLNLLVRYERPRTVSPVSGIPLGWQRSGYNVRRRARPLLECLLSELDAPFVLLSFNDEGFVSRKEVMALLKPLGSVEVIETRYPAFRGSRSFEKRSRHVTEHLFVVERS